MKAIIDWCRVWLLLGCLCLMVSTVRAQDSTATGDDPNAEAYKEEARDRADPVAEVATDDRAPRTVRYPAPARMDQYRQDRDYRYNREPPPPDDPVGRFVDWLLNKIVDFLRSPAYRNGWQYVLLAAIVAFTVYLLWKADLLPIALGRRAQQLPLDYDTLTDDIYAIDFDRRLQEAIDGRQYRLAVRLLYLQTLKHLTNKELIDWQPDKTNRHYARQLANTALSPGFDALTTRFEYVWYGDFPVDAGQFGGLRDGFSAFDKQITATRPTTSTAVRR